MTQLYPEIEPHQQVMLPVGDGVELDWEVSGNPEGKPVVFLHGGRVAELHPNSAGSSILRVTASFCSTNVVAGTAFRTRPTRPRTWRRTRPGICWPASNDCVRTWAFSTR